MLFEGKPEAEEMPKVGAAQRKAAIAKERERLVVPADPAPTLSGFEFVVADEAGKHRLIIRDAQHEYTFVEDKGTASQP